MTTPAPLHKPLRTITPHHITPGDTVKLAVLTGPADGSPTTVVFEVWEPGGAQPLNWHDDAVETFVVLAGQGHADSDEHTRPLAPGDVLVLPRGSRHRITNTSATERLYTLTVMSPDEGFADLIERGPATTFDDQDLAVLRAL
jgi:mannose-6-phosphate isomerase-like protein (cupin superfamily)